MFSVLVVTVALAAIIPVWLVAHQRARKEHAAQVAQAAAAEAERPAREAFLKGYANWTDYSYSLFDKSFIAVDMPGRRISVGVVGDAKTYSFDEITAVELMKDGGMLTLHRDRPGAPLVGGVYFEERAILAAIESPTNTVATVRELGLKVTVNDTHTPVYEINFFHVFAATGLQVTENSVIAAAKRLDKFNGYLANALRDRQAIAGSTPSTAEELQKLWDLRQAGAITDGEYDQQKAKLLSA